MQAPSVTKTSSDVSVHWLSILDEVDVMRRYVVLLLVPKLVGEGWPKQLEPADPEAGDDRQLPLAQVGLVVAVGAEDVGAVVR